MYFIERLKDIAVRITLILLTLMMLHHRLPAQTFTPTRFTVVDAGTAGKPDVVLIPGLSSSRAVWDAEAKLLAPNYRLHLVQLNGFAGQPAGANATGPMLPGLVEELHAYIAANKMHPAVVGHSLGGLLTLMLAQQHPADVTRIVLVDSLPFYPLVMRPDATVENTHEQVQAMVGMLSQMNEEQYAAAQTMIAMRLVKNPEGQKLVAAASAASDRTVVTKATVEDMSTDVRPAMATMKTPTLMLYPYDASMQGSDVAAVDAIYQTAYKPAPNVSLKRMDDSRHFIMYDQPTAFDAALEAFLK